MEIVSADDKIAPMEFLSGCLDFILHLDHHLNEIITNYGAWTYLLVFLIIFCETGLVVTPFLPGDSLLFVLGAIAAQGSLNLGWLLLLLCVAAIGGNMLNYQIGRILAPRVFRNENIRFLKKEYLDRTREFYAKYGTTTIIITRFFPIIRTFAPFLAGVGAMTYWRFALYNFLGGVLWIAVFVLGGYFFGNLPVVKNNFSLVVVLIIVVSLVPAAIELVRHRRMKNQTSL